jgi:hypothetical protein
MIITPGRMITNDWWLNHSSQRLKPFETTWGNHVVLAPRMENSKKNGNTIYTDQSIVQITRWNHKSIRCSQFLKLFL